MTGASTGPQNFCDGQRFGNKIQGENVTLQTICLLDYLQSVSVLTLKNPLGLIPSFLGIKVSLVSRGAADQNPDSEPSSAKRNTYRKSRYESSLSVRAFVQLPRSTLLSNELQMTFYSHNICWPLAAVTSLSSLHSVPPTVFISFFHSPPPGSRRILL